MTIQTQPGIFHIHVDATEIDPELSRWFIEQGVLDTPFTGHPEGYEHFEPNQHMTLKITDGQMFKEIWDRLVSNVKSYHGIFRGYLEGEWIPTDDALPETPYVDVPVPFSLTRRRLSAEAGEDFRDKEIHLTFDKNRSHPEMIQKLLSMGLYGAYVEKSDHVALVLTAQGDRKVIDPMVVMLRNFLTESGGLVSGTFKDEFAIRYYRKGIGVADFPEVVDQVIIL